MIEIKKLTVKNFLGFGEIPIEFSFDQIGTTLISGHNGAGKTSILNGVVVALYGKALSNGAGKIDDLINNVNKKNMEVTLEFTKDKSTYKVVRARKMKSAEGSGNYVNVFKNKKDITPDSINNSNKLIESIVGIPYDLFIRVAAISATYVPFLELPVKSQTGASQTGIIEELFNLTSLTEKANILKEQIKVTKHSLEIQHAKREALHEERERHESQLNTAERRMKSWQKEIKEEIADLTESLAHSKSIDVKDEKKLFEQLETLSNELAEIKPDYRDIRDVLRTAKDAQKNTEAEMQHLEDGNCPYCKQKMKVAASKLSAAKKSLKKSLKIISESEAQIEEITKKMDALDDEIDKITDSVSVNSLEDLYRVESRIDKYATKLADLESQDNPHMETLTELLEIQTSEFDMETINELDDLLKHQNMVLKLLTKKDSFVRKNLINKNIPFLNKRLNHYLNALNLTQLIEFKHDMSATVSKFGRALNFGNLSNGQKARVNLAMSFAFREVLQNLYGHLNICLLDEVLDVGLDSEGALIAAEMLKKKGSDEDICIYVISHKEELQSTFDRTISVSMVDDFTHITYPD